MTAVADLAWPDDGLLPVAIVDARTNELLTLAYANREAVERTIATRSTWLWSRSRGALWNKGESSGNAQRVVAIDADCDRDALVYRVVPSGPACHTGARTCFHDPLLAADGNEGAFIAALEHLRTVIAERRGADPATSYVAKMLAGGVDRVGKKIGEEATEVVIAAKNDDRGELVWEVGDLVFHTMVMLALREIDLDEIGAELRRRAAG